MIFNICLKSSTGVITNSSSEIFEIQDQQGDVDELRMILEKISNGHEISVWSFETDVRKNLLETFGDILTEDEIQKYIDMAKRLNHYKKTDKVFFAEVEYGDDPAIDYLWSIGGKLLD